MKELIVALDVDTVEQALTLAGTLRGVAGGFKIGSRLFTAQGPGVVEDLVARGDRLFLDLKFHDIPHTVAGAVAAATRLGVWMINVHASGGVAMMQAARQAANDEAGRLSRPAPLLIAVTVLTSIDQPGLADAGVASTVADQVRRLATLAQSAGLDGVVASPHEIGLIREACGDAFVVVTPGIRSASDDQGDQRRTLSAADAIATGASYLVVGRPIIAAANPRLAAERLAGECRAAASR
jgi:orotidine-5'-phosphate decarboxylase